MSDKKASKSFAPFYACFLAPMVEVAREHGYAMAVHGSMNRDLDLVCVPWVDDASDPETLIDALQKRTGGHIPEGCPELKPHGRLAWSLAMGGAPFFDISVMPKTSEPTKQGEKK